MSMDLHSQDAIDQLQALIQKVDKDPLLQTTFQNVHQGYVTQNLTRFLKARDWDPSKAYQMLLDCLNWRVQNQIDNILSVSLHIISYLISASSAVNFEVANYSIASHMFVWRFLFQKPILPADLYRTIRDSQLIGVSGYTREGLPVFAIGAGLSTFDKASVHYYVQSHIQINEYRDRVVLPSASKKHGRPITTCVKVLDMTGLKLSALNKIKLLTIISSIDDQNYPEKSHTYYIVNAPYVFSACWKVVKPLLQERTRRKVQVLPGCGRDELLKIMDYPSLPHFCRKEGSGSSRHLEGGNENCYSLDHPFHQQLYNYINQQARLHEVVAPIKQGSFHVEFPEPPDVDTRIAKTIESEFDGLTLNGDKEQLNNCTGRQA
ncbi:unnamed protein product [Trifolium pratense]|uniref:Uncharacterized protein n=1 Tax=Trifolium pratense TaxID=57577 RepID=A0ACB0JWB8_TRIPR|nr:unnamed protein product [Trifolium pratense]